MNNVISRKVWGRSIAGFLVIAIILGISIKENKLTSHANEEVDGKVCNEGNIQSSEDEILEDGTIKTTTEMEDGTKIVTFVKDELITIINYDNKGNIISEEKIDTSSFTNIEQDNLFVDEIDNMSDICDYDEEDPDCMDEIEEDITIKGTKTKWNKLYKETWALKDNMWYRTGTKGKTSYLKIGCQASYLLNYTKLSSDKKGKCDEYKKAIRNTITAKNAFVVSIGVTAAVVVSAIIAWAISGLAAAIVKKVGTVFKIFGDVSISSMAASAVLANSYREDAKDAYLIIRTYGKKC